MLTNGRVPVVYLGWVYPNAFAAISAVLLFVTLTPGSWTQRIFAWRGLRIVGVLSFSLYLVHYRIISLVEQRVGLNEGFYLFMATLSLSLLIAVLFERFIERPSMSLGRRINARLGHSPSNRGIAPDVP